MPPIAATLRSAVTVGRTVRVLVLLGFALVVARHWHPYFGFTSFLQFDPVSAQLALPVVREGPIYVHPEKGTYDGDYYAQIATDPSLRDPALARALDNPGYRARRILLSAVAWVGGGGDAVASIRIYAWLNIALWFVFAGLLWRILPPTDGRATLAWALMLAGAGVLFSVRLALTDLAALGLTAVAVRAAEQGRPKAGAAWLGLAALTRETGVLAAVALLPARWRELRVARLGALLAAVVLPLGLWLLYVNHVFGESGPGESNFAWPLAGWAHRWWELVRDPELVGNPRLQVESFLEHVALTVQFAYLVWRPRWSCPWWRVGAVFALLMVGLGFSVWEGFPNAASRVLLPLTLAFNVLAVRHRAAWWLLLAGNLSVFAGEHALESPRGTPRELPVPVTWSQGYLLETDARWSVAEWNSKHRWAWCAESGGLSLRTWPAQPQLKLALGLSGRTPRTVEVKHAGRVVWRGPVGTKPQWVTLPELPLHDGRLDLEVSSDTPGVAEGADNTARRIGIACFGIRLAD